MRRPKRLPGRYRPDWRRAELAGYGHAQSGHQRLRFRRHYLLGVPRLYAVVDTSDWSVVEWTPTRAEAEQFIDEVRAATKELAAELDVAVVDVAVSRN